MWDSNIIETAEERYYDSEVNELIDALKKNITVSNPYFIQKIPYQNRPVSSCDDSLEILQTVWSDQAKAWESCSKKSCPNM